MSNSKGKDTHTQLSSLSRIASPDTPITTLKHDHTKSCSRIVSFKPSSPVCHTDLGISFSHPNIPSPSIPYSRTLCNTASLHCAQLRNGFSTKQPVASAECQTSLISVAYDSWEGDSRDVSEDCFIAAIQRGEVIPVGRVGDEDRYFDRWEDYGFTGDNWVMQGSYEMCDQRSWHEDKKERRAWTEGARMDGGRRKSWYLTV
ncbi:hypothetical protein L204_106140 [Cryptococcus depauperatus]|nr:hypothetical protein L204_05699 [Cryptococcus depauperatus CBS 7855]